MGFWDNKQIKVNHNTYITGVMVNDIITVKCEGDNNYGVILTINDNPYKPNNPALEKHQWSFPDPKEDHWEELEYKGRWYVAKTDGDIFRRIISYPTWKRSASDERVIGGKHEVGTCLRIEIEKDDYWPVTKEQFLAKVNPRLPPGHPDKIKKKEFTPEWWHKVDKGCSVVYCNVTEKDGDRIRGDYYVELKSSDWKTYNRKFEFLAKAVNGWCKMSDNQTPALEKEMRDWLAKHKKKEKDETFTEGWFRSRGTLFYAKINYSPGNKMYFYNYSIRGGEYYEHNSTKTTLDYWDRLTNLDEIQQYLPNGHVDKMKKGVTYKHFAIGNEECCVENSFDSQKRIEELYTERGMAYPVTGGGPGVGKTTTLKMHNESWREYFDGNKVPQPTVSMALNNERMWAEAEELAARGVKPTDEAWKNRFGENSEHLGIKDPNRLLKLPKKFKKVEIPIDTSQSLSPDDIQGFKQHVGRSARLRIPESPRLIIPARITLPQLPKHK